MVVWSTLKFVNFFIGKCDLLTFDSKFLDLIILNVKCQLWSESLEFSKWGSSISTCHPSGSNLTFRFKGGYTEMKGLRNDFCLGVLSEFDQGQKKKNLYYYEGHSM